MDKELPKSDLGLTPAKTQIRVSKSYLPGSKCYKANVFFRQTIDIEGIAERIVDKRSEYRKETLINTFSLIKHEIYNAIESGFNVDFGFGRLEVTVAGSFESEGQKFDRKRHVLTPNLRPSPQLRQRTARIPAENITCQVQSNSPHPYYVSLAIQPRTPESTEPYNRLPAGTHPFISIYGDRLKLMGDLPCVGLMLRCVETGEEHFYTSEEMLINSSIRLCFTPGFAFTPGEWEATVITQFNPSYRLYKKERVGYLSFTVL